MNEYFSKSNGMSISAQRFVKELRSMGQEVRVLAGKTEGIPDYPLAELHIPFFDGLIHRQGFHFAKAEDDVIREAVEWADLIHLEDPFIVSAHAARIAEKLHKPCTAAFHLYPENITSSIHLGWFVPLNNILMASFRTSVYRYCSDIQCPTKFVRRRLRLHRYQSRLHVISNGVPSEYDSRRSEKPEEYRDKFVILCVGRYSLEKRQDVLIRAAGLSGYAKKLQLIFAGQGPLERILKSMAKELPNEPVFEFFPQEKLREVMSYSDLYVHCAQIEVEGMSCLEATAMGIVPLIADSWGSSTKKFALDERSIFPSGNPKALAAGIDYWIEHEEERTVMSGEYRNAAKSCSVAASAEKLLGMFRESAGEMKENAK